MGSVGPHPYVDAIKKSTEGDGYHVYVHSGYEHSVFMNVNPNIVTTMFGKDFDYLLKNKINSVEYFRPLLGWEEHDLNKNKGTARGQ